MTGRSLSKDAFSLMIRRTLYILVGENRWGYRETYHNRISKNKYSSVGKCYDRYINLDLSNYDIFMRDGSSAYAKGLSLDTWELQEIIEYCEEEDTTASDIKEYCDDNLYLDDLYVCIDGTYVSVYNSLIWSLIFLFSRSSPKNHPKFTQKRTTGRRINTII